MDDIRDLTILKLANLRESLIKFAKPEVLKKIFDLCDALGTDRNSFVQQYKFWVNKNGKGCRYASLARTFFIEDQSEKVAKEIIWHYHNWAKHYEKE